MISIDINHRLLLVNDISNYQRSFVAQRKLDNQSETKEKSWN